jgi:hypothetical protein
MRNDRKVSVVSNYRRALPNYENNDRSPLLKLNIDRFKTSLADVLNRMRARAGAPAHIGRRQAQSIRPGFSFSGYFDFAGRDCNAEPR